MLGTMSWGWERCPRRRVVRAACAVLCHGCMEELHGVPAGGAGGTAEACVMSGCR